MSLAIPLSLAALGGGLATAIAAHDFFEGETLVADLIRTARLARANLADLDRKAMARTRCDAIVTLTTIPSRIDLIGMTLKSLLDQTTPPARIHLNIPHRSRREDRPYSVPAWLEDLEMVRIVRCDDVGPATKLFPTLADAEDDQAIIVVDDDRIYPPGFVKTLTEAANADPHAAFGLSGWVVPADLTDRPTTIRSNLYLQPPAPVRARRLRKPFEIDILQGFSGYLVRPRFFPRMEAMLTHRDAPPGSLLRGRCMDLRVLRSAQVCGPGEARRLPAVEPQGLLPRLQPRSREPRRRHAGDPQQHRRHPSHGGPLDGGRSRTRGSGPQQP